MRDDVPGTVRSHVKKAVNPGGARIAGSVPADPGTTTFIGSYCLAIASALQASGIDAARIFRSVDLPVEMRNDPMVRLPTVKLTQLYRACVEVTNNPYFGLVVARHIQMSNLHALGYALAASSTLMDYCRRLERFFRLVSHVATVTVTETGNEVRLGFERLTEISGETEDAFLAFTILSMRSLYQPQFNPLRVEFHRPKPYEGAGPYEEIFRAPISFSHPGSLLVFDRNDLAKRLDGSCPELAQVHDTIAVNYLARLDRSDVIAVVTQKIIAMLPEGECSREQVAAALNMSPTTLQFKLAQRGTSFQQLLDDMRKELACSYITQESRSVTEITFLLGFSDTSNFARAFKRWTGRSPTEFRRQ